MRMIKRILWTWSWQGFVAEFADGTTDTLSARQLLELVNDTVEFERLRDIAHRFPCNCFKAV